MMRKGFSLLELLVASLLLGMLMTILTMIFNQSSIAWRTGIAGLTDLDNVRETVGQVRNEADSAYIWNGNSPQVASVLSIWDPESGDQKGVNKLRKRAIETSGVTVQNGERVTLLGSYLNASGSGDKAGSVVTGTSVPCGQGQSGSDAVTYSVNVRSAGPDRKHNTYDDIWSFPDDFSL